MKTVTDTGTGGFSQGKQALKKKKKRLQNVSTFSSPALLPSKPSNLPPRSKNMLSSLAREEDPAQQPHLHLLSAGKTI